MSDVDRLIDEIEKHCLGLQKAINELNELHESQPLLELTTAQYKRFTEVTLPGMRAFGTGTDLLARDLGRTKMFEEDSSGAKH